MIFDNHMHTNFSSDSTMKLEEVIEESRKKNLGAITTEHLDLDYPDPTMFQLDIPNYFKAYEPFRNNNLKIGIEIGLNSNFLKEYTSIINSNDFDYVIGSVHSVNGLDIYLDFFKKKLDKDSLYIEYLKAMHLLVEDFDCFDALGHIDYPCRYAPFDDKEIHFEIYKEYIDKVLISLINKEKLLELNTNRLNEKERYKSLYKIYTRYKELGGKYVTLGSDAHGRSAIAINFESAYKFIEDIGLKPVHFENRIMHY